MPTDLRSITDFDSLLEYLAKELDWPVENYTREELTFEYDAEDLGLKEEEVAKLSHGSIQQLRPLQGQQPFGIFFVEFDHAKLPIVVLRRILSQLVIKKRSSTNSAEAKRWDVSDLIFISAFGEEDHREIAFAHFHKDPETTDLPVLRVLGWHGEDTRLKSDAVARTLKNRLSWPENEADQEAWRQQWRSAFKHKPGHTIRTAKELATTMAGFAKRIRNAARGILPYESESGRLRKLYKGFQDALIHDLSEDDFTTYYAETICYGLFTVAVSKTELSEGKYGTAVAVDDVAHFVPVTNPFLKEMLWSFLEAGGRNKELNFDDLGINEIVSFFNSTETDLPAVIRDFGSKRPGEDPVIHLYEDFLKQFDAELRKKRGVYYTPKPVVSYIVRSVHELLKSEFGIEDGLASTVTWGDMQSKDPALKLPPLTDLPGEERTISPDEPFVQILDPATGTATFLVEVIEVIHKHLSNQWTKQGLSRSAQVAEWNEYVPKHLLPRLHGYELMMAPYAIAHMKIGLKLAETGYRFKSEERARVYLTNALESWMHQLPLIGFDALAKEAAGVNEIKRHTRFTVVIGNPPYSVTSANFNPFIDGLMEDYKKHVKGEQGLVALADDYLKFVRLSQKVLEAPNCGVWGMITNHGFLKGVIHRGVRKELLGQFNAMFILDLHGDSNIGEKVPTGKANENVFDIQQGVSVSIGVRPFTMPLASVVRHSDLWGSRCDKYDDLASHPISLRKWAVLHPVEPRYFLIPFDDANLAEYQAYPSLNELMVVNSCGVKTHRDGIVIDYDMAVLVSRMSDIASEPRLELLRERYGITDTPNWKLKDAQLKIRANEVSQFIRRITYRPFDFRWIYYNPAIIEKGDSKFPTLRHMLHSNIALLSARIQASGVFDAVFVSKFLVEMKTAESSRSCTVFPLFLSDNNSAQAEFSSPGSRPNLSAKIMLTWAAKLGVATKGDFDLPAGLTPEDIFHYAYAVFHSPGYRSRYAEFLKIDFPRLPLTGSLELFSTLARLGGELTALHLLESPTLDKPINAIRGNNRQISKVGWTSDSGGTVWIDGKGSGEKFKPGTSGFQGVPEEVWNFHIGGYQVCEKWLKDRKGRTLSDEDIAHYHKIVVALSETIRLMAEIDEVIETNGGWPGAFQTTDKD